MLKVGTFVKPADNSGASLVQIFGIFGGSGKTTAKIGDVVIVAVKSVRQDSNIKKHEKSRAVVVRTRKNYRRPDGSYIRFDDNAVVLLEGSSSDPRGTRIFGPVAREIKALGFDKIVYLAPEVL